MDGRGDKSSWVELTSFKNPSQTPSSSGGPLLGVVGLNDGDDLEGEGSGVRRIGVGGGDWRRSSKDGLRDDGWWSCATR